MGIGTTEEHQALADSVRGLTTRTTKHAALAGQGILGLHLPEQWGGQGYGLLELCVALEALGERRVPGPYLPTVLASAALTWPGTDRPAPTNSRLSNSGPSDSRPSNPGSSDSGLPGGGLGTPDGPSQGTRKSPAPTPRPRPACGSCSACGTLRRSRSSAGRWPRRAATGTA
ncbi:acyl-CoA dehydrogenase family protein [Nonomuraea angiospora]|uniref:acyl-CoA dehydrogenase family protein n=1 Tax=Nonomuraea angiospora TaxID=46172 RepID=UPI0038D36125